jgi:ATP-dependent protease ClpP protease subunit
LDNFKYINNISEEVAEIRIYKRIGSARDEMGNYVDGVNGSDFANEMAYLATCTNKINVRINSGGGSVLDAMAIQASILNSKVPCECYIDGIAASAAATIAVSGRKCYMADNGIFMIHNAVDTKGGAEKKVMDVFNESIATILTNRTGKSNDEIVAMMAKETWMNAKQCLEHKIIDEVISTKKKVKAPKITNVFEMEKIYNEFLTKKPQMENINNELGIDKAAPENATLEAIKAIKTENQALKAKVTALEKEKNDAIEAEKNALKEDVTNYANKLVADKKIKEDEKAALIANASVSRSSFEFIKNIYDKVSTATPAKKIFDPSKVANALGSTEDRSSWKYSDWGKKDPKGLQKMANEFPEQFDALYNAEFKPNK